MLRKKTAAVVLIVGAAWATALPLVQLSMLDPTAPGRATAGTLTDARVTDAERPHEPAIESVPATAGADSDAPAIVDERPGDAASREPRTPMPGVADPGETRPLAPEVPEVERVGAAAPNSSERDSAAPDASRDGATGAIPGASSASPSDDDSALPSGHVEIVDEGRPLGWVVPDHDAAARRFDARLAAAIPTARRDRAARGGQMRVSPPPRAASGSGGAPRGSMSRPFSSGGAGGRSVPQSTITNDLRQAFSRRFVQPTSFFRSGGNTRSTRRSGGSRNR